MTHHSITREMCCTYEITDHNMFFTIGTVTTKSYYKDMKDEDLGFILKVV